MNVDIKDDHIRFYHKLIEKEIEEVGISIGSPKSNCSLGKLCALRKTNYCISREKLRKIADEIKVPYEIVEDLIKYGYIVDVTCRNKCFRSFHVDFMIRVSHLTTNPLYPTMTLGATFVLNKRDIFYRKHQRILPGRNDEKISDLLNKKLRDVLGDRYWRIFLDVVENYFKYRNSRGFSVYQAKALIKYLDNMDSNVYTIVAPTGMGKTEIFMFMILINILYSIKNNRKSRIIILYPRKMLEVNQAERLILLLYLLNKKLNKNITLYIRDGDTLAIKNKVLQSKNDIPFRGISFFDKELMVNKKGEVYIKGENNKELLEFIIPFHSQRASSPDVVITNIHTLMYRAVSPSINEDIDIRYIINSDIMVLDEAHEYDSIMLGNFYYLLLSIYSIKKKIPRLIISSATIPNHLKFAKKLYPKASSSTITDLSYDSLASQEDDKGKKLELTLFVKIKPSISWTTYLSELSSILLFYYYGSILDKKFFKPQSIIFINNVKELNRTASVLDEALKLGSPLAKLCIKNVLDCEYINPKLFYHLSCNFTNAFSKAIEVINDIKEYTIESLLRDKYDVVFSSVNVEDRINIYKKFNKRQLGLLLATSSLELGMDYPQVSVIVNAGFDRSSSIIQRFGRGGRSRSSLYTSLNILVVRNNPMDYTNYANSEKLIKISRGEIDYSDISYPSVDTPALKTYALLRHAVMKLLLDNKIKTSHIRFVGKGSNIKSFWEALIDALKSKELYYYAEDTVNIGRRYLDELIKKIENLRMYIYDEFKLYEKISLANDKLYGISEDIQTFINNLKNIKQYLREEFDNVEVSSDVCKNEFENLILVFDDLTNKLKDIIYDIIIITDSEVILTESHVNEYKNKLNLIYKKIGNIDVNTYRSKIDNLMTKLPKICDERIDPVLQRLRYEYRNIVDELTRLNEIESEINEIIVDLG